MTRSSLARIAFCAALGISAAVHSTAEIRSKSKKLIVLQPQDLPEEARTPGEGLFLYASTKGDYYLYEEKNHGAQLVVFNVSDPAKIKTVSVQDLAATGPFDFMLASDPKTVLIRYRNGAPSAILDLSKSKEPVIREDPSVGSVGKKQATVLTSPSTSTAGADVSLSPVAQPVRDFQVLDTESSGGPDLVTTVKQVKYQTKNKDMGTTFLLNSDGLTVVRSTDMEQAYAAQQAQLSAK